ncbi:MAG: FHA domain-containing protein [Lachnospiraceae bacterium]|nr:FHA domain-containing protein [Lachnospiraceae bacterium]
MQVRYKRDMNRNYMILELENEADYQLKMLCANKIKGLLPAHTNLFNGNEEIYYDISSRQPISRLYEKKELQAEDIKAILFSLQAIFSEIKKYLLDYRNILFVPEFCYCNPENKKTEWVFFPEENGQKGFMELAEFFIERVDHADKDAVDLAYRFFKGIKEENFVLDELINVKKEESGCEAIEVQDVQSKLDFQEEVYVYDGIENQKEKSFFEKIKQVILGKVARLNSGNAEKESPAYGNRAFTLEREHFGFEENHNYSGETVVMGVEHKVLSKRLKNIDKSIGDYISLTELPCVFGKMKDCADVVLQDKSVSRMHARIFQKEDDLYLEDLNSTNGTYLNGIALESNEIIKIKVGDEIGFGNLRYIYE